MATRTIQPTVEDEVNYLGEAVIAGTSNKPATWFRDYLAPEFMAAATLPTRSTVRSVERGRIARVAYDEAGKIVGFDVKSDSGNGTYRVTLVNCTQVAAYFGCNCKSGIHRPGQPVPCFHAATVARSLVRRGLLRQEPTSGIYVPTELAKQAGVAPEPKLVSEEEIFKGLQ